MTGAVMLASRAALRAGAGIVVAGLPGDAAARASGGEVITRALPATSAGALDEAAVKEVLDGLDRFRALVVGPGLGQAPGRVAAAGAWIHGRAGDEAGHRGLVAGDLIDALPAVLAGLTAWPPPGAGRPNRPNRPKGLR